MNVFECDVFGWTFTIGSVDKKMELFGCSRTINASKFYKENKNVEI